MPKLKDLKAIAIIPTDKLLSAEIKQISVLRKGNETELRALLVAFIFSEVVDNFNSITDSDVSDFVELIEKDYWHFKLPDLKIMFSEAKRGKYNHLPNGKIFGKPTIINLAAWIEAYDLKRQEEIISLRQSQNIELKRGEIKNMSDEKFEAIKKILSAIPPSKEPIQQKKIVNEVNEKQKDVFQDYMQEFNKLDADQKQKQTAIRFVTYKKKKYSMVEYCNARHEEDFPELYK